VSAPIMREAMRISVVGTSGSGKSTLARKIAGALDIPFIELDAINWQPGWRDLNTHDPGEFRRRVEVATQAQSWVVDGNYGTAVGAIIRARATHLVWLDYDRRIVMARVIRRSFTRAFTVASFGRERAIASVGKTGFGRAIPSDGRGAHGKVGGFSMRRCSAMVRYRI